MKVLSKVIFVLTVLLLGVTHLFAQAIDTAWTRTYGGTSWDEGYSVQQTTDGGYIVTGYTSSYGAGGKDVYLIKTNSSGDTLWTRTYGGIYSDIGRSVQQTTDGGYIIAGETESFGQGYEGYSDVYLIKTNSLGDTLWTRTYRETNWDNEKGYSVQQTTDGGYIVAGYTESHGRDIYLIKTDSAGNTLWTKTYGRYVSDRGYSVQQTTDGGYIIAGAGDDYYDVYLIKTDSAGNTLWTKTYGGVYDDEGYSVQQTTDGGYIIAGATDNYYDIYLIKTDSAGDTLYHSGWTKTYGGTDWTDWDVGYSVQQTTDGGYIVAGYTDSYGAGGEDVYLIKTIASGDSFWTKTYGGSENDRGYSIQQTTDGGYIVAGWTDSYGAGGKDVYLIKIKPVLLITITSPNGGENWRAYRNRDITWASSGTSGTVNIEYSINNGSSWSEVIDSIPDTGAYSWTIPNTPSDSCLVRITDTDGSPSDTSDGVFTILPASITIVSPNGGEEWQADSTYNVTWTSIGTIGFIKIKYSANNGSDWTNITTGTWNDGTYPWTVPNISSDSCLVRITDEDGYPSDTSDGVFTILPVSITIVSPNGGEEWQADSTYDITWTSTGTSGNLNIEYSTDNGSNWTEIIASTVSDGTHPWTIPDTPSDSCLVRITDTDGSPSDTSDGVFSIFTVPFITVTSPNGGEEWQADSTYNVTWTSTGTTGTVNIEYSTNNGSNWTGIIASTVSDGTHPWTIPDTPSDSCLVRITDTDGSPSDTSDAVFAILPVSGISADLLPDVYSFDLRDVALNNRLEVRYALPEKVSSVRFVIYDITGKKVKEEKINQSSAGFYSKDINIDGVSKGVYFIRIEANGRKFTKTSKFVLM